MPAKHSFSLTGFTIVRNARKFNYPVLESIRSILPICDEFIVNVGDSEDDTLALVASLNDKKIKIIETKWDMSQGKEVLSTQTNAALAQAKGDWAFYLQSDEVIHEQDLPRLKKCMERFLGDEAVDALRFKWLHFYGSFHRYRIDSGWYQKQDRIIQPQDIMAARRKNAERIGFVQLKNHEKGKEYIFGDLSRFPVYFGTHPKVMDPFIENHLLSRDDKKEINKKYWWNPVKWFKVRYKTFKRMKQKIE
ncbi:MAG: glycosyltransferase [Candidatus Omnitrophica bacterium]|nr:glycosyltransferase [Candidatus Omnitrophota bacterium]